MEHVLVVGAGFMGSGIAQVCAQAGYRVSLMDIDPTVAERALRDIRWSVEKLAAKGVLKELPQQVLARISTKKDLISAAPRLCKRSVKLRCAFSAMFPAL